MPKPKRRRPFDRAQELLVAELHRTLLLSLDDLTAIKRAHIHPIARSIADPVLVECFQGESRSP